MKVRPLREVKAKLSECVRECQDEPVFITKNGKVTALLTAATDEDIERLALSRHPGFLEILERSRQSAGIPEEEFWRLIGEEAEEG